MEARDAKVDRWVGLFVAAVIGSVANAGEPPDPQLLLAKLAGFNEASLSAGNVVFDVQLRETASAPWRAESAVVVLADGGLSIRRSGADVGYATCTKAALGSIVSTSEGGSTYFVGHRVDMSARDCDATSCAIEVDVTLAVDHGLRREAREGCTHETPNVASYHARIAERAPYSKQLYVDLGIGGEVRVTLGGGDYLRSSQGDGSP